MHVVSLPQGSYLNIW